ncbi:MAG: hypothetical protein U9P80_08585 [Thermodesulfobacteriota bacterium]|nr:hypothetical protein [Thermodesulfobacteriota bacterium]
MKKFSGIILILVLILSVSTLHAIEIEVETIGNKELKALKPGIEKSIHTRCVAKGIDLSGYDQLNITLIQMGDTLSFDALLNTTQPRAFHKDIKGINAVSQTIEEMISGIFNVPAGADQSSRNIIPVPARPEEIKLDIKAVSLCVKDHQIFVADKGTIYCMQANEPRQWWTISTKDEIFRIWTYKDSIIALIKDMDQFRTYRITDKKVVERWDYVVVPKGNGLLSASLRIPPNITRQSNRWSKSSVIEGTPYRLASGEDITNTIRGDILPDNKGMEVISYSYTHRITISSDKDTLWKSGTSFAHLPLYVKKEYIQKSGSGDNNIEAHVLDETYYMEPRILLRNNREIIAILNQEGLISGMFKNVNMYKDSAVLSYAWEKTGIERKVLSKIHSGYCADIALQKDTLIILNVTGKNSRLILKKI